MTFPGRPGREAGEKGQAMKTYLVTGGAGFIGSHLVEELVNRGDHVRVMDNFLTGKRENIEPFLGSIDLIEGDICDYEACLHAADGVDYVLHQAALPSVPRSVEDPQTTDAINIRGTLNMLMAASRSRAKKFVFASSSSVYGDDEELPKREGKEGNPLSPYALSKLVGEKYCWIFNSLYKLPTVSLRYFNVFGPRQDPFSLYAAAVPNFITLVLQGKSPRIFGDGEQSRDFTYVANVVDANLLAAESGDRASGEAFNIACAERITVNALLAQIKDITGSRVPPVYEPPRPGDIRHSFADISKAGRLMEYKPRVGFREGLDRTISWYMERSL